MPWQDVWCRSGALALARPVGPRLMAGRTQTRRSISWASPQDGGPRGCAVSPGEDQLPTLARVRPCAACPEVYSVGQEYVRESTDNADCKELSYEPPPSGRQSRRGGPVF